MFISKKKLEKLMKNVDNLNYVLTKNNLIDLSEILGNRKELLIRNLISGIAKGIGVGIKKQIKIILNFFCTNIEKIAILCYNYHINKNKRRKDWRNKMKKKIEKRELFGKIMAGILVGLMLITACGTLIYYLLVG